MFKKTMLPKVWAGALDKISQQILSVTAVSTNVAVMSSVECGSNRMMANSLDKKLPGK